MSILPILQVLYVTATARLPEVTKAQMIDRIMYWLFAALCELRNCKFGKDCVSLILAFSLGRQIKISNV